MYPYIRDVGNFSGKRVRSTPRRNVYRIASHWIKGELDSMGLVGIMDGLKACGHGQD